MDSSTLPLPQTVSIADRVLDEGAVPLVAAVHAAGLKGEATPSLKTLLRACITGRIEAVKVAGRWLTSPAAVRRWISAAQKLRASSSALVVRADGSRE